MEILARNKAGFDHRRSAVLNERWLSENKSQCCEARGCGNGTLRLLQLATCVFRERDSYYDESIVRLNPLES